MMSKLSKEAFIKLAEAYSKQEKYENELKSSVHSLAEKYKIYTGFIGLTNTSDLIMDVTLDLLGDDFSYYFYDCNESFDKFNKNTTLADGTHPTVKDFGELWEFSQKIWDRYKMKYYTSDLHLSHKNIIEYEKRPFSSIEEMNNTIIDNINYRLSDDDELYILGDFTLEKSANKVSNLIKRIKCKKHLIIGNHDYFTKNESLCNLFDSVQHYLEIEDNGQKVILFHYPIQNWNLKHYGSIHLYGHVHSKEELQLREENAFNVGVDVNDFNPITLKELQNNHGEFK